MGNSAPCANFRECLCFFAFLVSGFDGGDPSTWNLVMDNETIQNYATTGQWVGLEAITEYLSAYGSSFIDESIPISPFVVDTSFSTRDECVGVLTSNFRVRTKAAFSNNNGTEACIDFTSASIFRYQLTGRILRPILMTHWDIWTEIPFASALFAPLESEATTDFMCDLIVNVCNEPGVDDVNSCRERWAALPSTDNDYWLDGDSKRCRMLHGIYTAENTFHCPHITFASEADGNGLEKCSESKGDTNENLFSAEMIESFKKSTLPYESDNPNLAIYPDGNCPAVEEL